MPRASPPRVPARGFAGREVDAPERGSRRSFRSTAPPTKQGDRLPLGRRGRAYAGTESAMIGDGSVGVDTHTPGARP
jgi:hypothetical protein